MDCLVHCNVLGCHIWIQEPEVERVLPAGSSTENIALHLAQAASDISVIPGDMQELVQDWVEVRPNLVFNLLSVYPHKGRPLFVHREENSKIVCWRRATGEVVLSLLFEFSAEEAMGAPISLLTFKRAVGGGMAAGASASLRRTADCAVDVNIHIWKQATGYRCVRITIRSEKAIVKTWEEKVQRCAG